MQRVLVIDKHKQPLMPCHPARARQLLKAGKAAVFRRYPFTIILKEREGGKLQSTTLKIDPGSRQTGLALVSDFQRGKTVIWAAILEHRGHLIKKALESRHAIRRSRRLRKTRYRMARFNNRRKPNGWLPPSLQSRVENIWTWCRRIRNLSPVSDLSQELVKFDTQALQNSEITGVQYQRGTLYGYEVREYLLEKWGRKCAYCNAKDVQLQIEHIIPRSRDGTDRVSNLTLACHACNQSKGSQTAAEFGHPYIQKEAKLPLKDAQVVNSTRWVLYHRLESLGIPLEVGSGGRTKFNRTLQNYPKTHWIDAACVGESGAYIHLHWKHIPLHIRATGRGSRQMCRMDKYGFPRTSAKGKKRVYGFQTGDIVKAIVSKGKKNGTYIGRVAVRSSGCFDITTHLGIIQGINHKYCVHLHQADGYTYQKGEALSLQA